MRLFEELLFIVQVPDPVGDHAVPFSKPEVSRDAVDFAMAIRLSAVLKNKTKHTTRAMTVAVAPTITILGEILCLMLGTCFIVILVTIKFPLRVKLDCRRQI